MLVHSVFEAAPPASVRREAEASERERGEPAAAGARTAPSASETDSPSTPSSGTATPRAKHVRSPRRTAVPDSPLAKLYGRGGNSATARSAKRRKSHAAARHTIPSEDEFTGQGRGSSERRGDQTGEVDALKQEVQEVRESQLRMEELLNKLLAGGGD